MHHYYIRELIPFGRVVGEIRELLQTRKSTNRNVNVNVLTISRLISGYVYGKQEIELLQFLFSFYLILQISRIKLRTITCIGHSKYVYILSTLPTLHEFVLVTIISFC